MKRIPISIGLFVNLRSLSLVDNPLELPEEQAFAGLDDDAEETASRVAAYFERRFGFRGSFQRLFNALRMFALPGIPPSLPQSLPPFGPSTLAPLSPPPASPTCFPCLPLLVLFLFRLHGYAIE